MKIEFLDTSSSHGFPAVQYQQGDSAVNIAIDIPDDIGHVLAAQAGGVSHAEAFHDYMMDDLEKDIAAIRDASHKQLQSPMQRRSATCW